MQAKPPTTAVSASSVTLLLTLVASAAAQGEPGRPATLADAYQRALARMLAEKAPGLVFVLPPADAPADPDVVAEIGEDLARQPFGKPPVTLTSARDVMLWRLQALRASTAPEVAALLALTLQIVAEPTACAAKDGETVVLLSERGERVAGFAVDLADHAAVLDALAPHVLAPKIVEPRRANVPPDVARIAARYRELLRLAYQRQEPERRGLDPQQQQEFARVQQQVASKVTVAAPALVDLTGERAVFDPSMHWLRTVNDDLPFGTEVGEQWDPCPGCGMMVMPAAVRSTLELLAR